MVRSAPETRRGRSRERALPAVSRAVAERDAVSLHAGLPFVHALQRCKREVTTSSASATTSGERCAVYFFLSSNTSLRLNDLVWCIGTYEMLLVFWSSQLHTPGTINQAKKGI